MYPVDDDRVRRSAREFTGETRFVYPVWRWATTHVETTGAPTWVYRFEREPPLPEGLDLAPPPDGAATYGAFHTSELPYTGDNLACRPWDWSDTDRELARSMADAWARFVTEGDPGEVGGVPWPRFDGTDSARVMAFGDVVRVQGVHRIEAMRVLDALPPPALSQPAVTRAAMSASASSLSRAPVRAISSRAARRIASTSACDASTPIEPSLSTSV